MNALQHHLTDNRLNEIVELDRLQEAGIVSDNCVEASDVADADCDRAVKYLRLQNEFLI